MTKICLNELCLTHPRNLEKKNMYLTRNDRNHHSFNIYIEAVNEIYGKYNGGFGYVQSIF